MPENRSDQPKNHTSTAIQNWQAMAPDMQEDIAQMALTSADTVLYQWDIDSGSLTFSHNVKDVFPFAGHLPDEMKAWKKLIDPRDRRQWQEESQQWMHEAGTYELRYRLTPEGQEPVWVKHNAMHQQGQSVIIGAMTFHCTPPNRSNARVFSKVNSATRSAEQSYTADTMNAGDFICQLQHYMDEHDADAEQASVVVLHVKNLSLVTHAFGHSASEKVMQELYDYLPSVLPVGTAFYRIHHNQLGFIIPQCDARKVGTIVQQLGEAVEEYGMRSSVGAIHLFGVCGLSSFGAEDCEAAVVVDKAFTDLHRHPGVLNAVLAQNPEDRMMARQQMGLANYLAAALREDKLKLAFQPIISTKTGEVGHYEALLRLIDDNGNVSSAGALIPVAERMGLIDMVDRKVLEMVVAELETDASVRMALNVSNLTTENPEWLAHCQKLLRDKPEVASRLIVEITETAAHRDIRRTAYFVAMVQELGCQVALDDFGSGYTSFRQLKTLSVDMVKIDGEFIRDLCDNADNRFFVKTLLEFTELFGLTSVAEFVENGETAKLLMELGVDYLQGYYFGKPENQRGWLKNGEYQAS